MIAYSTKVAPAPTVEPVVLSEAKAHLRIPAEDTGDDAYITALIMAAREIAERYTNLTFITQVRQLKLDRFPCTSYIELPYGPVASVTEFTYLDSDGASQPLVLNTDYVLDIHNEVARVQHVNGWPSTACRIATVTIKYSAGFGALSTDVPYAIRQAILMQIANLYENRQDEADGVVTHIAYNSTLLLDAHKVYYNANVY